MKRLTILDQVMNAPVSVGGFTWTYGFVHSRFDESLKDRSVHGLCMQSAQNNYDTKYPDTRKLEHDEQKQLWDAMGDGDMATINRLYKKIVL